MNPHIDNIGTHTSRAGALTSLLMTYLNQDTDQPSEYVMGETLAEIRERLDAIAIEVQKAQQEQA